MGTRGYIVVKYNDKYYVRYNHMDSYPEYLGKKIVSMMRTLHEDNVKGEQYKENILSVASDSLTNIEEEKPETTLTIEWIYIIDLQEMTFEIKGGYHEPSYKIQDLVEKYKTEGCCGYCKDCKTHEGCKDNQDSDYNEDCKDNQDSDYNEDHEDHPWLKEFSRMNEKLSIRV